MLWNSTFSAGSLEQEYQAELVSEKVRLTRILCVLAISLNLCFVALDLWAIPSELATVWMLRAAIVAALVLTFASTWHPAFERLYPYVILWSFAVMGMAINAMVLLAKPWEVAIDQYYGGLLLIIIGLHTLTYVKAGASLVMSMALLGTYAAIALAVHDYSRGRESVVLLANLFIGVSVTIIGIVAQSLRERYSRENYLLRHSLQRDVEIKEEEKRRASYLAEHDPLTGLANRMRFEHDAGAMFEKASRSGGRVAVMFIDLDGFKPVNDTHGHAAGDRALRAVAERLSARLRAGDLCARVGGDEFVVALSVPMDDHHAIGATARRLASAISVPVELRGATLTLTASVGVAVYPHDGVDLQSVLAAADERMYHVKRHGKSGIAMTPGCDYGGVAMPLAADGRHP